MSAVLDRAALVRRHTRILPVPLVPEIRLHLAQDATDLWQQTETDLDRLGLPPPFWAFAWPGGQALARYLLDRPGALRGARILDVASGSGLVAIAAAIGGAGAVEANEIDGFALAAIPLNAALNGVTLIPRGENLVGRDDGWEIVLAADIFYERETAGAVTAWLLKLAGRGARVLVGDPGRSYFDPSSMTMVASYDVPVMTALEDADTKTTGVWRICT